MHPLFTLPRKAFRRAFVVALGPALLLAAGAMPVAAYEPIDLFEHEPTPTPQASDEDVAARVARPTVPAPKRPSVVTPRATPAAELGYDVSWPQCNDLLPESLDFAVVGVNRGRTYSENECLAGQLAWAGPDADFYVNTANPGPDHSQYWPSGAARPRDCDARDDDTSDCAYVYGWNAAADAYGRVLAAFVQLGWADADAESVPGAATWWLDVETANTWRGDRVLNVAALQGAVDFLESKRVAEVGFYSTPLLWWRVTRGTDAFDAYPAWHAGAHSRQEAEDRCGEPAFTGGELRMVQWIQDGIDTNLRCS